MRVTPEQWKAIEARRKPKNKYGAKKKLVDGIEFHSTKEARRYQDLVLMQRAGQIRELRRQVPYPVYIKGKLICEWFADFVYWKHKKDDVDDGHDVVEDCKGHRTDIYRLKKKMVEAEYGFKIVET